MVSFFVSVGKEKKKPRKGKFPQKVTHFENGKSYSPKQSKGVSPNNILYSNTKSAYKELNRSLTVANSLEFSKFAAKLQ